MALTNNEKQIRHKRLEELKKYANTIIIQCICMNTGFDPLNNKSNEEIREDIQKIVNLPAGWTDEDYEIAKNKIYNYCLVNYENPYLMKNDIEMARTKAFKDPSSPIPDIHELKRAEDKSPEVVRNIKSILKLSELKKTDQIAVIAEVMRQLAREILNEKDIPKTYANATAFSLIGHQFEKPEWTWKVLANNLYTQNSKEKVDLIVKELTDSDIEKGGILWED